MAVEKFLIDKMLEKLKFAPTACQKNLFETLADFISGDDKENWLMLVNGYAGTGKTTAISSFVKVLSDLHYRYILLAPTGRSAKVLANYTGFKTKTIHKQIYRQKSIGDGFGLFSLDMNKNKDTVFVVDEVSLISTGNYGGKTIFGSGDVLGDLVSYVRANTGNRLILVGDPAQLPPVGMEKSPALDPDYLKIYGNVTECFLKNVVRQAGESGILNNATILRNAIEHDETGITPLAIEGFPDVERIMGGDLIEKISDASDEYGPDGMVVLCRSNKRANIYNMGIRNRVFYREEQLTRSDKLMIVKNCYQFLDNVPEMDFIANGDVAELLSVSDFEERYGLHFAKATIAFPDYENVEITVRLILDTLTSESAALGAEQQKTLFDGVYNDYEDIKTKKKRLMAVREDQYFNALQIKYATAITCHKSQGGQWDCVFIDNCFWREDISVDDKKWLYTAITRAVKKVYLVNFNDKFFR
ncbi:MAG: AAA family ATPase [Bacteroidales bacterium]|jgi:exodeoxyribonuclease-5|nr:AAA family ATPase [Bacteroidales bacterium]